MQWRFAPGHFVQCLDINVAIKIVPVGLDDIRALLDRTQTFGKVWSLVVDGQLTAFLQRLYMRTVPQSPLVIGRSHQEEEIHTPSAFFLP